MSDLAWGKPINFISHKGGKDSSDAVIARLLKVQETGIHESRRIWVEVHNGPGQELPEGAIKPSGKPSVEISVPLIVFDARKMGCACLAYLQAWDFSAFSFQRSAR